MSDLTRRQFVERGTQLTAGLGLAGPLSASRFLAGTLVSGGVSVEVDGSGVTLDNGVIAGTWTIAEGTLRAAGVRERRPPGAALELPPHLFVLTLGDGTRLDSTRLRLAGAPTEETLAPNPIASRLAERLGGKRVTAVLRDPAGRLEVTWRAELREGSHYLRQEATLRATGAPLPVREIAMVDLAGPHAVVTGTVRGSPVTLGNWFVGFEHPLTHSTLEGGRVRCVLPRELPLRPESPFTVSSVIGIARAGQMRRDFLAYLERERAHPYRTFLHYNSWYDIGYFSPYSEPEALAVVDIIGGELKRRGVQLDSFLFDDGWDDPRTLWGFHSGFPDGFARVREAADRVGAAPGVWLSPWGGYGNPKQQRLEFGRQQGFETNEGGFALSGPRYYQRFRESCFRMLREYGINQFKFDGTGNASRAIPGSVFDSDFDAAIKLIEELRAERPGLYVNLTTGTYPSPFWLRYADSIWRGGEDHDFAGVGTQRQQWITYRDAQTHANVVTQGSLFPLSSLMLHGLVYARHARKLDIDPGRDFRAEIQSFFGSGTQLQELYLTPTLTQDTWDTLAEAALWARRNAETLRDTHWIGGDPARLEVYGWAAWSGRRGTVTLRNPSDRPQRFELDPGRAFELPAEAPGRFTARSPWARDRERAPVPLAAGGAHVVELAPFEVLTLEADPA